MATLNYQGVRFPRSHLVGINSLEIDQRHGNKESVLMDTLDSQVWQEHTIGNHKQMPQMGGFLKWGSPKPLVSVPKWSTSRWFKGCPSPAGANAALPPGESQTRPEALWQMLLASMHTSVRIGTWKQLQRIHISILREHITYLSIYLSIYIYIRMQKLVHVFKCPPMPDPNISLSHLFLV